MVIHVRVADEGERSSHNDERTTMFLLPVTATSKNPPERFAGDVWLDIIAQPKDEDQRMTVALVRFAPGAHTAWHSHARGQTLHITSGVALIGTRDGAVIEATAGQTIYTQPGEEHWHGAAPDAFMEHLAMSESAGDPATATIWLEHLEASEYHRPDEGR
jgi:quercetin dioxygenase-like cupin family protein